MWKDKHALFTGLTLFGVYCLTRGMAVILETSSAALATPLYAAMEALIFLAALATMRFGTRRQDAPALRLGRFPGRSVVCVVCFAAMIGFGIQAIQAVLFRDGVGALPADLPLDVTGNGFGAVLAVTLLPAVVEELFLRGAVLSSLEKNHATGVSLVLCGLFGAMLCSSRVYLLGAFLMGWGLSYLTYAFGSVWAAVVGRFIYQLVCVFYQWMSDTYGVFGIGNYGSVLCLMGALLFGYLAMRSLHKQLARGRVRTFQKGVQRPAAALLQTLLSPGMIAFLLAFATKTLFMVW